MSASTASQKDILHFGEGHRRMNWKKLAVTLLIVLPILAAMVFMWALYDPSKSLREVDLAVVNQDAGIEQEGETTNFGESVVEGLLARDYLSFAEVSEQEAKDGLANGTYLFTVTIPENFSKDVATLMDEEPKAPEIAFEFNDFNGTNSSVLTGALVPQIKTSVSSSISESYAERLIGGVNQLGGGIKEAAAGSKQLDSGAGQIDEGLSQSYDGTAQLNAGANQLRDGAQQLNDGTKELSAGTGTLVGGTTQLRDGVATLVDGTAQLGDGAGQIDAGVGKLTGMAIPALKQAQDLAAQVRPVIPMLRQVGLNEQATKLEGVLGQLDANNPDNLVSQLQTLKEGTATLHYMLTDPSSEYLGGMLRLQDGIGQVHDGATQLNDGAIRLDDGATQLNSGSGELAAGTEQLLNGQSQLKAGSSQLKDGTTELSTKLGEGAKSAPTISNVEASSKQVAVPIKYVESNANPVQLVVDPADPTVKSLSGGASMLMILVFGFLLMAVAAMSIPHVFGANRRTSYVGPTLISFLGLVAVGLVILAVLAVGSGMVGWSPQSKSGIALAFLGMASAAAATNQMLRALLGRVTGALAMLGLFALGMFSFGGVWPLSTVPGIFQIMHPLTPMKYGRDAFVYATQGDLGGTYVTAIIALAIFTVVPLLITLTVRANRVRKVNREFEAHQGATQDELVNA